MRELDREYPQYGFAQHKGYSSRSHMRALFEHGPSPVHRQSFRPVREAGELRRRIQMDLDL
jgi:ribonuclease HII